MQRLSPGEDILRQWTVDVQSHEANGPCAHCKGTINFTWEVEFGALAAADDERYTRRVTCNCDHKHDGAPKDVSGCGGYFIGTFYSDQADDHVELATDSTLVAASLALEKMAGDAEARMRGSAEKWVAGVASLLALFGIATTATGGKLLEGADATAKGWIAGLSLVAIALAILAMVLSSLAAYAWPKGIAKMDDGRLRTWYSGWANRLDTIGRQFRFGVGLAILSIVLLTVALGIHWLYPSEDSTTRLKVTAADGAQACGVLLSAKDHPGAIRIRVADGSIRTFAIKDLAGIESGTSC